ncbi:hypothetical protein ACFWV1_25435 [Streptomyces sp. NPDC058700]|uniref:hypothetical protein n=1 Tax=Streptomyces sp. NPDC058700 TaxID=3346607 RepID=UPI003658DAC4
MGTVRQMQNLRLLEPDRARQWARISPSALRSSLAGGAALPPDAHVHVVTAASHLQHVHADVGDVLITQEDTVSFVSLPKGLARWTGPGQVAEMVVVTDEFWGSAGLEMSASGMDEPVQLTVVRDGPRTGVHDVWPD